ncbi:uncharacterized protein [Amphiura filiformis]|uniref:uncharacterized protein n=1 Tax=Amphiura filiformis TaxID=82378 RepID=UPI003B212CF8
MAAEEESSIPSKTYSTKIQELLSINQPIEQMDEDDITQPDEHYWYEFMHELDETHESEAEEGSTTDPYSSTKEASDRPIYRGHWLSVHFALLLILTYSIAHSITGTQLSDLLTLISYFMLDSQSHPAFRSLYFFRKYFADIETPLVKHFFCHKCFGTITSESLTCPNEFCKENLEDKKKLYFVEMSILNQIKNLFGRDGFFEKLQHRFNRKKSTENNIEDLYDGKIYKNMFDNEGPLSNPYNISFCWNTDGVPVFKSSKFSLWPIYLSINELDVKYRMRKENMVFAGLWFGDSKPVFPRFTEPLLRDLKILEEEGIDVEVHGETVNSKAFMLFGCADLPAKSSVMNMNQFNGKYSCLKCLQSGRNERTAAGGNIHIFPFIKDDPTGPQRTESQCVHDALAAFDSKNTVNGIKGPSFLLALNSYSFVQGSVIDYMHGVLLGISKVLINLWFTSANASEAFSVYSDIAVVDARLLAIKVTHNISRVPRALGAHFKYWKASEFRSWLLYYSLPILADLMEKTFYYHYACFVEAIHLLSGSSISTDDIKKSYNNLVYFVFMFEPLYGSRYCGLNLHSLLHLPETVVHTGPLWAINCFGFEDANGQILKLFHGTQNVEMQIMSAVNTLHLLPQMIQNLPKNSKTLMFINKMQRTKSVRKVSSLHIEPLGKGYTKAISSGLFGAIMHCIEEPPGKLVFYNRLIVGNSIFHSTSYNRVVKRNSYTVKYFLNGNVQFGRVSFYAENLPNCMCKAEQCSCCMYGTF